MKKGEKTAKALRAPRKSKKEPQNIMDFAIETLTFVFYFAVLATWRFSLVLSGKTSVKIAP
jgi:hypothetical protein